MLLSLLLAPRKMNLELLMGRGAASPHLKPLSELAIHLLMCHHGHCLPRDRILWIRWSIPMEVRLGSVLPDGPASVLQAGVTPQPVLTQLLFTRYPNDVISKKSLHAPRSIGYPEGLLCLQLHKLGSDITSLPPSSLPKRPSASPMGIGSMKGFLAYDTFG